MKTYVRSKMHYASSKAAWKDVKRKCRKRWPSFPSWPDKGADIDDADNPRWLFMIDEARLRRGDES